MILGSHRGRSGKGGCPPSACMLWRALLLFGKRGVPTLGMHAAMHACKRGVPTHTCKFGVPALGMHAAMHACKCGVPTLGMHARVRPVWGPGLHVCSNLCL
eukprot:350661-Chlamydomonas_euryale.AAC.2